MWKHIVHLHQRCDEQLHTLSLAVGCELDLARRAVDAFTRIMGMFSLTLIRCGERNLTQACNVPQMRGGARISPGRVC